jgi:hypothetical protein
LRDPETLDLGQKMNSIDYSVLKNYKKRHDFPKEHQSVLNRAASIGYVKFGFNVRRSCETVKLTEIGRRWVKREEIKRSPIRRFLHTWINNLF